MPFSGPAVRTRADREEPIVPTRRLPSRPSIVQLRTSARELQRDARAGDPDAVDLVAEHHPRSPDPATLRLSDAQLVVARLHGFASWPRLKSHLDVVMSTSSTPHDAPTHSDADPVGRFLALACLTYGGHDDPERRHQASAMLDAEPTLATRDVWTMAASGEAHALETALAARPELVDERGGPHRWPPLLYACYSRVPLRSGQSTLATARVLIDHGADPDAGFLWEGLPSPFTALAGAFGGGEDAVNQPPHPEAMELARLLLDAGADANDNQALYNRMFEPDDAHLELLFEHGLGQGDGGPWRRAMPEATESIPAMLAMQLQWAAEHDMTHRVALLLDHGVDPDGQSGHPAFRGRSPLSLALTVGATGCADLLRSAGASEPALTPGQRFVAACMAGDAAAARVLVDSHPGLLVQLDASEPPVQVAASAGRFDALELMAALGCDVNARARTTALHDAAARGDRAMVEALLQLGADPNMHDTEFDAPPLGWARHGGHDEVAAVLEPLTQW
jgi:Ankyrin repeat